MKPENTTDILQSDLENNENILWLRERFKEEVESYIGRELEDKLRNRVDTESLALTTLRQAIDHLKTDSKFRLNSEMFWRLVRHIAKCEVSNEIAYLHTERRNIARETGSLDDPTAGIAVSKTKLTPADQAAVKEELRSGLAALLQEQDEQRKLINLLGIALQLSGPDIQEILKAHPASFKVFSLATILRQLEKARARMRAIDPDNPSSPAQ